MLIILTTLTLLAFGLRTLSLDAQSMWRDEVDTFCFALDFWELLERSLGEPQGTDASVPATSTAAERPTCHPTPGLARVDPSAGPLPTLRALLTLPGWNGSLYTVAMRPWIGLTGFSPFALRYSSLFFGLLAVPLAYVLGRRLIGPGAGLVGAALVTFSPHLAWYSQEAKMYSLVLALSLLALYGLRRALDGDGVRWWGLMVVATTLALYSHILSALLIPLHVTWGLIWWRRTRRHWRAASVALACLTLPYLPLLVWQFRSWSLPAGRATLFAPRGLDAMLETTLDGWAGHFVAPPWDTLVLAGLALLALGGLVRAALSDAPGRWRAPLALLSWALLPLLGIWLISTRQPIFTNRYLIWAAPALYLLAAAGALALTRWRRGGALVAGGLVALVLVGDGYALVQQATQPLKADFRAAAAYLEPRYRPGDLVLFHISYVQHNFDFYFKGEYDGWGAPAPGDEMAETDLDFYMQSILGGRERVWLVLSQPEMWDPRGLVKTWLDAHAVAPPEMQAFTHVSVYRYQLSPGQETKEKE